MQMTGSKTRSIASPCHPREGGDPGFAVSRWIPAFAGMTRFGGWEEARRCNPPRRAPILPSDRPSFLPTDDLVHAPAGHRVVARAGLRVDAPGDRLAPLAFLHQRDEERADELGTA